MKTDLKAYLDHNAVDELLEWGECDRLHDPVGRDKISEPGVTHKPQDETKEEETDKKMSEPKNLEDLIYIISSPGDIQTARKLYADLNAEGLNPWMESEDLDEGGNMRDVVKKHIKISKYVLALISKNASTAKGFAQRELKIALDVFEEYPPDGIFLIPVKLDDFEIYHSHLDDLKPVNLYKSYDDGFKRILKVVGKNRKAKPVRPASTPQPADDSVQRRPTPDIAEKIEEIEKLFVRAQFRDAYEKFFNLCKSDSRFRDQAMTVLMQFNDFENQVIQGLLPVSDQRIIKQQIGNSFNLLFNRFKQEAMKQ